MQDDAAHLEVQGELAGPAGADDETGIQNDDLVDEYLDAAVLLRRRGADRAGNDRDPGLEGEVRLRLGLALDALVFGRDLDGHALDGDLAHVHRGVEHAQPGDAEAEFRDGDERDVGEEAVRIETQPLALNLEAAEDGDGEAAELDPAVEAGGEGLDDAGAQHGRGAVEGDLRGDAEAHGNQG